MAKNKRENNRKKVVLDAKTIELADSLVEAQVLSRFVRESISNCGPSGVAKYIKKYGK